MSLSLNHMGKMYLVVTALVVETKLWDITTAPICQYKERLNKGGEGIGNRDN